MSTTTDTEIARTVLKDRRSKLETQVAMLQGKILAIDDMIGDLDTPIRLLADPPKPNSPPKPRAVVPRIGLKEDKYQAVWRALCNAGAKGLTCREASAVTGIVLGTCSSILSRLKGERKASHKKPRYWAADLNAAQAEIC